jgi:hypothetical protein
MNFLANSLDDSSCAAVRVGTEDAQAGCAERVDDAGGEWCFRPDHRKVDALALGKRDQRREVGQRNVLDSRLGRGAAIARRHVDLLHARALRKLPGERVLPAARADDEKLHLSA